MAGPANFLRVSGPLGGATFLDANDYNAGRIATEQAAGTFTRAVDRGVASARNINAMTLENQTIAENEAKIAEQQRKAALNKELGVLNAGKFMQPQQEQPLIPAAPVAPTPAPVPQQPAVQAAPAQPAPVASLPSQITPEQTAAIQQATQPAPVVTQATAPTLVPTQAGTTAPAPVVSLPPTQAQPTAPAAGFNADALRQQYLQAAQGATQEEVAYAQQMVRDGKVSPEAASFWVEGRAQYRQKKIEDLIEFEDKLAKINDKDADASKKRVEIAAETRKFEDNNHFDVLQTLVNFGPEAAKAVAQEVGINFDPNDPRSLAEIERRAQRSPDFKEARKAAQEEAKSARQEAGVDKIDLNPGERAVVVGRNADGTPKVAVIDADGNKVSQSVITARSKEKAKAGATTVSVGTGGSGAGVQLGNEEELRKAIGKSDAEALAGIENSNNTAKAIINQMTEIKTLVTDPSTGQARSDLKLGPGAGISLLAERWGLTKQDTRARVVTEAVRMRNAEIELIAAGRMKGQGGLSDGERSILRRAAAGDIDNFTAADWQLFADAQIKMQKATMDFNNEKVAKIQSRNKNVPLDTFKTAVPEGPAPTRPAGNDIDKKWGAK